MDNKEKILQCALELFYARGYDAVGVQEIAETAGVTKPTLYYYFGSKKDCWKHCWRLNMQCSDRHWNLHPGMKMMCRICCTGGICICRLFCEPSEDV